MFLDVFPSLLHLSLNRYNEHLILTSQNASETELTDESIHQYVSYMRKRENRVVVLKATLHSGLT